MEETLLGEIQERSAAAKIELVSPDVGRLLATLVVAMQANRILEIGTGFGYATLWMASAQPPAGRIWTFDPDIDRTAQAEQFFERAGMSDRIEIVNQPALEVLSVFPQRNMDLVYIDSPAADYRAYLEHCLHLLKLSGLIVFHNVRDDRSGFYDAFRSRPEMQTALLPVGGGLAIGARKR